MLSEKNVTTGIWGVMNATKGKAENCLFFIPDPWTFSEAAYPGELNKYLGLPRYMARNYLNLKISELVRTGIGFLSFFFTWSVISKSFPKWGDLFRAILNFGFPHVVTYSFAELLSTIRFVDYSNKYKPDCTMIFLNLVAHAQHYYWDAEPVLQNKKLIYVARMTDRILQVLFESFPDRDFLITNGLSQMNTNHEKPWYLYRQIDHMKLLAALGVGPERVEACMTHDAHLFYKSPEQKAEAAEKLADVKINGSPLFYVENYDNNPNKLFYMIQFTDDVGPDVKFYLKASEFRFGDYFAKVVRRTGRHIPVCDVYYSGAQLPDKIKNHMVIHDYLSSFYPI
jgi:hypothetical protein